MLLSAGNDVTAHSVIVCSRFHLWIVTVTQIADKTTWIVREEIAPTVDVATQSASVEIGNGYAANGDHAGHQDVITIFSPEQVSIRGAMDDASHPIPR